jgi:hypothetical protein
MTILDTKLNFYEDGCDSHVELEKVTRFRSNATYMVGMAACPSRFSYHFWQML